MRRFYFTMTITGTGETLGDAWREATCTLADQPPYTENLRDSDWKEGEAVGPEMFSRRVAPPLNFLDLGGIQHKKIPGEREGQRRIKNMRRSVYLDGGGRRTSTDRRKYEE